MMRGVSGSLLSVDALLQPGSSFAALDAETRDLRRRMLRWHVPLRGELGPATGARTAFDRLAVPLLSHLGYRAVPASAGEGLLGAVLLTGQQPVAGLVVTPWGHDPGAAWRAAVHVGIAAGVRWVLICSGPAFRVIDSARTYSRRYVEFDLQTVMDDDAGFGVFRALLHADGMAASAGASALDQAVRVTEAHHAVVRTSLQKGVFAALERLVAAFAAARRSRRSPPADVLHESLTVIYRVLFLLFAEARGLVPSWHPVYRDAYTIDALRPAIERDPEPAGLWEALQAIARLAHRGCRVGALRVPPFNGHLFAPTDAPLADALPLEDGAVRDALLSLTTRPGRNGPVRIAYGDLGVEQLGGVYEHLLDFKPGVTTAGAPALVRAESRKRTGAFYTPRTLTEYLVRRTLAPLVERAAPERILGLKVLDPSMGSGAFLVSACRFLASAYEAALIGEGTLSATDVGPEERACFRRAVAQRCLYGVDVNPMAVQLGRLSLWLATLARDRPLTFLDHRLRTGNTLVGAAPADAVLPPSRRNRSAEARALPLFEPDDLDRSLVEAIGVRGAIALEPGDTLDQVRGKERALARLEAPDGRLQRWRRLCDLWCAGWFLHGTDRARTTAAHGALVDRILGRPGALPDRLAEPLLAVAFGVAERERFFHWALEFPEAFVGADSQALASPGFDAVIGNPPWEMLRADRGPAADRAAARSTLRPVLEFARSSGAYRYQGDGHANLYQLFLERSCGLVRRDGRIGVVLPAAFATDAGSAPLRRMLLDRFDVDGMAGVENRDGVFPIHRGLRFLLVTATAGGSTTALPARFGIRELETLERLPPSTAGSPLQPLSRGFLERFSGPALVIPDVRTQLDLSIASDAAFGFPPLGSADGWHVHFGRELNATDDRPFFTPGRGLPVIEGKQVQPFRVDVAGARLRIPRRTAARLLDEARTFARPRLAYRDVASATNRLTLIAAVVPAGVVTTHTLFCLKEPLDDEVQAFLCGMFNSFVANYLVRLQVTTHVGATVVGRLPVPRPPRDSEALRSIADGARRMALAPDADTAARLQARAAQLYRLRPEQFGHLLDTFPLVPRDDRHRAMAAFCSTLT